MRKGVLLTVLSLLLSACLSSNPPAPHAVASTDAPNYLIGPGDSLQVFVWRNPELTVTVPVRPDGKISTPLVEDMQAAGKTPSELAREIEKTLSSYLRSPVVTVIVNSFAGEYKQLVRVVGEAARPTAIPFRSGMTVLDVIISVGGLTEFADGNRATLVRNVGGSLTQYNIRLKDLIKQGDITANVPVMPGDTLIIPEAWL